MSQFGSQIDPMSQPKFDNYYKPSQFKTSSISGFQSNTTVQSTTTPVFTQPLTQTPPMPTQTPKLQPPSLQTLQVQALPTQLVRVPGPVPALAGVPSGLPPTLPPPPQVRDFATKFPPSTLDDQFQTPFSLAQINPRRPMETTCFLTPVSQKCNHQLPPAPVPIQLGGQTNFGWDQGTTIFEDCCAVLTDEKASVRVGDYQLSSYDPRPMSANQYANMMVEPTHYQQVFRAPGAYIDDGSDLLYGELTSQREKHQLFHRPYKGFFVGPGQPSLGHKDLESALQQGLLTNLRQKPCEVTRGTTNYRFTPLPEFHNPQRIQHIQPPPPEYGGWIHGGDATRDFVRRVDYDRRCKSRENGFYVNKIPKCGVPPARL
jgi:hypothetical protein